MEKPSACPDSVLSSPSNRTLPSSILRTEEKDSDSRLLLPPLNEKGRVRFEVLKEVPATQARVLNFFWQYFSYNSNWPQTLHILISSPSESR